MVVVAATPQDIDLLARLIRAEAEGEGQNGMLLVGNVAINRVRADCSDFTDVRTISQMVFQPHAFEATLFPPFYQAARGIDRVLAQRVINGERFWPAIFSLWYFNPFGPCPDVWFGQPFVGQYKLHCFYEPTAVECEQVYRLSGIS